MNLFPGIDIGQKSTPEACDKLHEFVKVKTKAYG